MSQIGIQSACKILNNKEYNAAISNILYLDALHTVEKTVSKEDMLLYSLSPVLMIEPEVLFLNTKW